MKDKSRVRVSKELRPFLKRSQEKRAMKRGPMFETKDT